jgi:dTDP-4-amino-4,6-dideoxygalactose transaminase
LAGLVPWIVDVSAESWALEANAVEALLPTAPGEVSAVVPVAPFGGHLDPAPWERFRERTGIAVVIDAAAAFDTLVASSVPAVVSLHATKVLGIGEGGYVLSTDAAFTEEIQKRANFGFWGSREATVPGLNGKISEYSAAVGLAALDCWSATRADYMRVGTAYRRGLAGRNDLLLHEGFGESWIASTVSIAAPTAGAMSIARALAAERIGSRRWWGGGLHRHAAFESFPRTETENTDRLVESVIGLPCWPDLADDDIARVCDVATGTRT